MPKRKRGGAASKAAPKRAKSSGSNKTNANKPTDALFKSVKATGPNNKDAATALKCTTGYKVRVFYSLHFASNSRLQPSSLELFIFFVLAPASFGVCSLEN